MNALVESIAGVRIHAMPDGSLSWLAGLAIDADGSPHAYHPRNLGLDHLDNARDGRGGWAGLVLVDGSPVVQGDNDPAPGFYVSPTAYQFALHERRDPRRYVDSETVPYVVVPPQIVQGVAPVVLGCKALVTNTRNGQTVWAVVADIGPRRKIGEASIACARALHIPSSPRTGGEGAPMVRYQIWPGIQAEVNGERFPLQPA